jgi:hypothetical protein
VAARGARAAADTSTCQAVSSKWSNSFQATSIASRVPTNRMSASRAKASLPGRRRAPEGVGGQQLSTQMNMRVHIYIIALLLFLTLTAYILLRFA